MCCTSSVEWLLCHPILKNLYLGIVFKTKGEIYAESSEQIAWDNGHKLWLERFRKDIKNILHYDVRAALEQLTERGGGVFLPGEFPNSTGKKATGNYI